MDALDQFSGFSVQTAFVVAMPTVSDAQSRTLAGVAGLWKLTLGISGCPVCRDLQHKASVLPTHHCEEAAVALSVCTKIFGM